jgi:hypothetical protein
MHHIEMTGSSQRWPPSTALIFFQPTCCASVLVVSRWCINNNTATEYLNNNMMVMQSDVGRHSTTSTWKAEKAQQDESSKNKSGRACKSVVWSCFWFCALYFFLDLAAGFAILYSREVGKGKEQPQPKIGMSDEYRLCCWPHHTVIQRWW